MNNEVFIRNFRFAVEGEREGVIEGDRERGGRSSEQQTITIKLINFYLTHNFGWCDFQFGSMKEAESGEMKGRNEKKGKQEERKRKGEKFATIKIA